MEPNGLSALMKRLDTLTEAVHALTTEVKRTRSRSRLMRQSDVCRELGVSEQVWVRWRKTGAAPPPADIPGRRLFWNRTEIERFASERHDR